MRDRNWVGGCFALTRRECSSLAANPGPGHGCRRRIGQLKQQAILAKAARANRLDIAMGLLHRMAVIPGEVGRDAHQAQPVDAPPMRFADGVLAGQEADAEQRSEIGLD